MQYVLGNMLNGGGINPDGLSLDLQFATDKTLTARRGPTPVFTRSSGDNGGTTYFGPLVDLDNYANFSTTGITNGRASWFISDGTTDITISYNGTRWRVVTVYAGNTDEYLAAPGSEWRPDQADWSGQGFSVTTSSTFGIVKAANNEPRFDHDPVTLACKGLLIEEGRTNLLQRSGEFGDAYWDKVRATISADQTASPTGETTADKLINDTTASNNHRVDRGTLSLNLNTVYTVSVFAKASEYSGLALGVDPSNPTIGVQFSLSGSGSVTAQNAGYTGTIQNFGNGWFRCTATFTSSSTLPTHRLYIYVGQNGTTFSYTGDGTSGIFIWGAQLEAGSFPTSYIPTTTGTLARSADVCNITGGNFNNFYNQSEGTFLSSTQLFSVGNDYNARYWNVSNPPNFMRVSVYGQTSTQESSFLQNDDGTLNSTVASELSRISRTAGAYQLNNARIVKNGTLGVLDTAFTPYTSFNNLGIMTSASGTIASLRYYRKRLPDAKLQALTV
jgi:hypothetical protein